MWFENVISLNDWPCSLLLEGRLLFAFLGSLNIVRHALENHVKLILVINLLLWLIFVQLLLHLLMLFLCDLSRLLLLLELVELLDCSWLSKRILTFWHLVKNGISEKLELVLDIILEVVWSFIDLLAEFLDLVGDVLFLNLLAADDLSDKEKLIRISFCLPHHSDKRVLHRADVIDHLSVAGLDLLFSDIIESLTENGNQQVEQNDNVEDATEEED